MDTKVRNIPPHIWHQFKILCAEENISMNLKMLELVTKEVEKRQKRK